MERFSQAADAVGGNFLSFFHLLPFNRAPSKLELPSLREELSRRLIQVEMAERKRVSRELHDETGQALMLLRLNLDVLSNELPRGKARSKVLKAVALLDRTIEGLRRILGHLSPRVLEEMGLLTAIRKEARQLIRQTGIQVDLSLPDKLSHTSPETEIAIYRCVQEAFHNISKHSEAKTVQLRLDMKPETIRMQIEDDGIGIGRKAYSPSGGFGLIGMRERIGGLGGKVRLSQRSPQGTCIRMVLPLRSAPENNKSSAPKTSSSNPAMHPAKRKAQSKHVD